MTRIGRNGHHLSTLEGAQMLAGIGAAVLPVPGGQKNPVIKNWRQWTCAPDDLAQYFPDGSNVGMLLGEPSNGLVDADLDAQEAVAAAPFYLPKTPMVFGRASKPSSHYVYRLRSLDGARELKYYDPVVTPTRKAAGVKQMLCELRYTGQTIAPGSTNTQDGHVEYVEYVEYGPPLELEFAVLKRAMSHLAAVAAIARLWLEGQRHALTLPLAGTLCTGGMSVDDALLFVRAVCAVAKESPSDLDNRLNCVRDTYERDAHGQPFTGGPTLEDLVGTPVVNKLREWLELKKRGTTGKLLGPDDLPLAHDGDGDRFVAMWGDKVLYCAAEKQWYIYNGVYWEPDRREQVREMAKETAVVFRQLVIAAMASNPQKFGQGLWAEEKVCLYWARAMGNAGRISDMLESARSRPQVAILPEQLDANPRLFNVLNWTIELDTATGIVSGHNHTPTDYITMLAPIEYHPFQTHSLFNETFRMLFYPEGVRWDFLQEAAAEAITGLPKRHSLNLIGETNSGKSMTLSLIGRVFGDYASTLHYTSLTRNPHRGGDIPRADLWRVRRKRLIAISEVPPGVELDVALYKALLSGGDKMAVRNIFDARGGEDVEWHASLWFSGNQPYGPPSGEEAAYERLLPLRCSHQVPEGERNQDLQLQTLDVSVTGSAVLNWILDGFRRLYGQNKGNIHCPDAVTSERQHLRDELGGWADVVVSLFEFTGDDNDAVLKDEAWSVSVEERLEKTGEAKLTEPRTKRAEFELNMQRHGAREMRSRARWHNRHAWAGVRWDTDALKTATGGTKHRVTFPDWKTE